MEFFSKELAEGLQTFGGWGVAALMAAALHRFWKSCELKDEHIKQLNRERQEELRGLLSALNNSTAAMTSFDRAVERALTRYEGSRRSRS